MPICPRGRSRCGRRRCRSRRREHWRCTSSLRSAGIVAVGLGGQLQGGGIGAGTWLGEGEGRHRLTLGNRWHPAGDLLGESRLARPDSVPSPCRASAVSASVQLRASPWRRAQSVRALTGPSSGKTDRNSPESPSAFTRGRLTRPGTPAAATARSSRPCFSALVTRSVTLGKLPANSVGSLLEGADRCWSAHDNSWDRRRPRIGVGPPRRCWAVLQPRGHRPGRLPEPRAAWRLCRPRPPSPSRFGLSRWW